MIFCLLCGISGFSTVEPPRTASVTGNDPARPRPRSRLSPAASREQPIGIGTAGAWAEEPFNEVWYKTMNDVHYGKRSASGEMND